ncbi:MAG TPA: pantoate--beta-alanine ligase [Phycisphaerae bacterium]|nr:pantoate--beta-alanine ligase [Phycisphaerae bacterium]
MSLKVATTIDQVREAVGRARQAGQRIGFVPTMGALHAGHLSLIRAARADCSFVVVSLFVNPTQFAPGEDYQKYPRTLDADVQACRREEVDLVFAPAADVMYAAQPLTTVHVARLTDVLCGPHRPGHFDGVTTVVAKLFNIVQPDAAYFGQKDAQQAVVIKQMTADLLFPVEIVVCPTVREDDGLAMSSRDAYLSSHERAQAAAIYAALEAAAERVARGERAVTTLVEQITADLEAAGPCKIDYVSIVDPETLQALQRVTGPALVAVAVRIGSTRLIDNLLVDAGGAVGNNNGAQPTGEAQ